MSNPFTKGDKVVRREAFRHASFAGEDGTRVYTVAGTRDSGAPGFADLLLKEHPARAGDYTGGWDSSKFRAAIAGQDYPLSVTRAVGPLEYAPNIGHHPDGSGVQQHSAGPLYPCVIAMRDGKLGGKYDYGVMSPRNSEPLWLSNHEAAVELALIIKKDLK